jgi:uncharacterized membrane protein
MHTGFTERKRAAVAAMTGAAAAAVTGLVIAGPAGASPVAASRPAAVSGTEHIQIMTTSGTATTASVIAWGVFTAAGVDHMGNSVDTIVFPGGTVKVKHPSGGGPGNFNTKTCLFTANESAPYTIVGGTGKYKGITGHGTAVVSIVGIAARVKGACSETAPPVAWHQVITGSGPFKLP